jgi:hypothetical protein
MLAACSLQVHYGYASLNPVSRTPALCVLPTAQLDIQQCSSWAAEQLASNEAQLLGGSNMQEAGQLQQYAVVCCDQSYLHLLPQLQEAMLLAYQVNKCSCASLVYDVRLL